MTHLAQQPPVRARVRGDWGDHAFAELLETLKTISGISVPDYKLEIVRRRIRSELMRLGAPSYAAATEEIVTHPGGQAAEQIVSLLTVNETYFEREADQLDFIFQDILPQFVRGGTTMATTNLLCLPCSTGEEPYSIAIRLHLTAPQLTKQVSVFGADIDARALAAARRAQFMPRQLAKLSPAVRKSYFRKARDAATLELVEPIRDAVAFRKANLISPQLAKQFPPMSIIVCRNVFIYFDEVAKRVALNNLFECLRPGGMLLLGKADSTLNIPSRFEERTIKQRRVLVKA